MNRWFVRGVILVSAAGLLPGMVLAQEGNVDQAREALAKQAGDEDASRQLEEVFQAAEKSYSLQKKGSHSLNYSFDYSYTADQRLDLEITGGSVRNLDVVPSATHNFTNAFSYDYGLLDNLTVGLAKHAARNLHKQPYSIAVLRRSQRLAARHRASYDITLTPTLATETPRVGHLRPDQDYEEIMGRLMEWVAFTPLQNATGEPAISLPLATTASGLPQGMMLGAGAGREARLLGLSYELEEAVGWPLIQAS